MELAIALYNNRFSIKKVAQWVGTSPSIIQRYFSRLGICRDKGWFNRGRKLDKIHCLNISNGWKKLLSNPAELERLRKGANNPFYGKKHNPETLEAMKAKLSVLFSGDKNPQWQGGISLEPYHKDFKKIRRGIYERDNYTCQECGIIHDGNCGMLVAHHKDTDKLNGNIDNLITLCRPCHGKITMRARWGKEVAITL